MTSLNSGCSFVVQLTTFLVSLLANCECNLFEGWYDVDLCNLDSCASTVRNNTLLTSLCNEHPNRTMLNQRCCTEGPKVDIGMESVIVGLDLSRCSLKDLRVLVDPDGLHFHRGWLDYLIAEDNPIENCSSEFYTGMSHLQYLSLPDECSCPGGEKAWNVTVVEEGSVICEGLKDICALNKMKCPPNSHCELHSPGFTWCVCDEGYHGYKCLRFGSFPSELAGFLLAGGALLVSSLMWFGLRRYAIEGQDKADKDA